MKIAEYFMNRNWFQFEQKLKIQHADRYNDLNPPAEALDIRHLEAVIKASLPEDFVRCLKAHNGQKGQSGGVFNGVQFLSCQNIATEWSIWKQLFDDKEFIYHTVKPDHEIVNTWWHPMWIPFTSDGSGNHLCIDLAPTTNGRPGQIISFFHDDPSRKKLANSFSDWLLTLT